MHVLVCDGSLEGWLTAVFEVYEYKYSHANIIRETLYQPTLTDTEHRVHTNEAKATRVWNGLKQKLSPRALQNLYHSYLSEEKDIEKIMLNYVQYIYSNKPGSEADFSNPIILRIAQTAKKVQRERHRMTAFVRFQLTADNLYYALVEPDFNVLPLIVRHFKERYADQRWLIYDHYRKYGIYYDLQTVETVELSFNEQSANSIVEIYDEKEELYQKLWQQYFNSVNIKARKNTKLHIQHMPTRYWKYLTEKKHFM